MEEWNLAIMQIILLNINIILFPNANKQTNKQTANVTIGLLKVYLIV
jgi:hypothetical protein